MTQHIDTIDKVAMAVSGGLMLLGIVVLGIVETLAGEPYGAAPIEETNEAGEVVNTIYPAIDPTLRTGLVILGLVILLLWGIYKIASPEAEPETSRVAEMPAD